MNAVLSLVLSCALLLAASLTASHAFAHEGETMLGEMAQMDHEGDTPLLADCCEATSGRTAPTCAFDVVILGPAFGLLPLVTVVRPRLLQVRAGTNAALDVPLGPPKI